MSKKYVFLTVSFILFAFVFIQSCNSKEEAKTTVQPDATTESNNVDSSFKSDLPLENNEIQKSEDLIAKEPIPSKDSLINNSPKKITSNTSTEKQFTVDNEYFYLNEDGEIITFEMPVKANSKSSPFKTADEIVQSANFSQKNQEVHIAILPSKAEEYATLVLKDSVSTNGIDMPKSMTSHTTETPTENIINNNSNKPTDDTTDLLIAQPVINNAAQKSNDTDYNLTEENEPVTPEVIKTKDKNSNTLSDISNKNTLSQTSSLVVINGASLKSSADFKEIKISDIESIRIVKENHLKTPTADNNLDKVVINTKSFSTNTAISNKTDTLKTPTLVKTSDGTKKNLVNKTGPFPGNSTSEIIRLYSSQQPLNDADIALTTITFFNEDKMPLYIMNGTRMETSNLMPTLLTQINPSDVESISFIKGSSATLIYGNDAIHGTILINTKTGNTLNKNTEKTIKS